MLTIECDRCGHELMEPGAVLLSPPDPHGTCVKFHACRSCWDLLRATTLMWRNERDRARAGVGENPPRAADDCSECGCPRARCLIYRQEQRKCCPDCAHDPVGPPRAEFVDRLRTQPDVDVPPAPEIERTDVGPPEHTPGETSNGS